ncbi:hypothetical protein JYU15_02020, partial [bacterium AH-315-I18]|nr:hypothetical protein [bacterium AH-315-I18]
PTEQKPAMLANARDSYLQLLGSPMTITPASGDLITAATLDYLVSQSRLRIRSNNTYPLLIDSRQLGGLLTAKNYEMYLDKGLGLLLGEGELRSLNRPVIADATQTKAIKKQKSLPPGTSVSWKDRVELLFFKEAGKNKPLNFDAVKTITFRGKVDVQHDLLDVQSDTVTLHMTKPTEKKSKQETSLIEASGNVALRTHSPEPDKQMALHADIARIHFKPDSQGKMQPIQLTANDNVVIRQPQQVLWANKLTVDLVTGEQTIVAASDKPKTGEPQQTQPVNVLDTMLAWEDEQTPVPTVTDITTNPLEQSLETEKSDTEKSEDLSSLHVQLVTVEGDVRARLINNGQPVFAFAHRITGDENQVELFGNDQRPAQVIHDQGILAGGHMVLTPKDQNLHVIGQGTLSYISQPMGKKPKDAAPAQPATSKPQTTTGDEKISEIHIDATNNSPPPATTPESTTESITEKTPLIVDESDVIAAPALPSLDPAQVTVTWQDNMHYNHESRQAHFLGNVLLQARKMLSTTTVKGDDIRLLFNKFAHAKKPDNKQAPDMLPINDQGMVSTQSLEGGREVRMVNITGKAEFLEESWADPQKQNLLTRLQIAGDTIIFDAVPETITIPGPGTLLHEDHRPIPGSDPGNTKKSSASKDSNVQFTGKGRTLFRWQDQFLLDIAHNDMIMKNYVQMLHIPADSDNGIQMDCRTFLADMKATGGLGTWLSSNPPTPDLKVVQASHDVRITTQNRQITTDRATYIHDVRKVKLQADKNKLTRITTPSGTSSPGAELIVWELDTNRFYIARPGRMNEVAPRRRR